VAVQSGVHHCSLFRGATLLFVGSHPRRIFMANHVIAGVHSRSMQQCDAHLFAPRGSRSGAGVLSALAFRGHSKCGRLCLHDGLIVLAR
jgi:hypothetical protein